MTPGKFTTLGGVNGQLSGLTIGTKYYVQYDGVITSTPNTAYNYKPHQNNCPVVQCLL